MYAISTYAMLTQVGVSANFFLVLALNIHTMYTINNVYSTGVSMEVESLIAYSAVL